MLVAKGLWGIVDGTELRPASPNARLEDHSSHVIVISHVPTAKQARWDGRDANAHGLIALSMNSGIIPHIH